MSLMTGQRLRSRLALDLISRIFNFLNELLVVLVISAPVRIALSFEIVEIMLNMVWVIEPRAHIASGVNVSPKFLHAAPTKFSFLA